MRLMLLPSLASLILASTPVFADELFPLKHGTYVSVGTSCDEISNANAMNYFGDALHFAGMSETMTVEHKAGSRYTVKVEMSDVNYPSSVDTAVWILNIPTPTDISIKNDVGTANYRWCPTVTPL